MNTAAVGTPRSRPRVTPGRTPSPAPPAAIPGKRAVSTTARGAPLVTDKIFETLAEIRHRAITILLVEQKLAIALRISSRLYVMGHGRIVFEGTPDDLGENSAVRKEWLEV